MNSGADAEASAANEEAILAAALRNAPRHNIPWESEVDILREFAATVGGKLIVEEHQQWIFRTTDRRVVAPVGPWSLTLDTVTQDFGRGEPATARCTRVVAHYRSANPIQFKVGRAGSIGPLARQARAQGMGVGDLEFDRRFIVERSDGQLARRLFSSPTLRDQVRRCLTGAWSSPGSPASDHEYGRLESKIVGANSPVSPFALNRLGFETGGVIKDATFLVALHRLFGETLTQLARIGCALQWGEEGKLDLLPERSSAACFCAHLRKAPAR